MPILAGPLVPSTVVTATAGGVTITVTSDDINGRLAIDLTGGPVGTPVYVLRRDTNGTSLVRPTSLGTALWLAGTPTTVPTFYEYEARQGLQTDFIVTDQNGAQLVTARFVVPTWGTWLKSPGKPSLNLRCDWQGDDAFTRSVPQVLLQPRGSKFPLALTERRNAPVGSILLATNTDDDALAMGQLIADGQVLMVDVPPQYGVPVRYVSVGAAAVAREVKDFPTPHRLWTLPVTEVAAPIGLAAGAGFTYDALNALASAYIGFPAIFATYGDLAIGVV